MARKPSCNMTTWQLIRTMIQRGYQFEAGEHVDGYKGYWARFVKTRGVTYIECDECGQEIINDDWKEAGHATTPHRAVVMAAKIALGQDVTVPSSTCFKV